MTRQEKFDQIADRLNKPENKEKLEQAKQEPGCGLWWHFNRAQTSLKSIENTPGKDRALFESDFSVSARKVEQWMNEQGWK